MSGIIAPFEFFSKYSTSLLPFPSSSKSCFKETEGNTIDVGDECKISFKCFMCSPELTAKSSILNYMRNIKNIVIYKIIEQQQLRQTFQFNRIVALVNKWQQTCMSIPSSCNKSVKIRLVATCHLQTYNCYNLLKQLVASQWITSFDNQLAPSLLTTCNRLVVNNAS